MLGLSPLWMEIPRLLFRHWISPSSTSTRSLQLVRRFRSALNGIMVLRVGCHDCKRVRSLLGTEAVDLWEGFLHITLGYVNSIPLPDLTFREVLRAALREFQRQQRQAVRVRFRPRETKYRQVVVVNVEFGSNLVSERIQALVGRLSAIAGVQVSSRLNTLHMTISKYGGGAGKLLAVRLQRQRSQVHSLT
jgi:hypothetical protein